jgi:hypothetical protein
MIYLGQNLWQDCVNVTVFQGVLRLFRLIIFSEFVCYIFPLNLNLLNIVPSSSVCITVSACVEEMLLHNSRRPCPGH